MWRSLAPKGIWWHIGFDMKIVKEPGEGWGV